MSNTLSPHALLSKLEEPKLYHLTSQLSAINANQNILRTELEKIEAQLSELKRQQQTSLADGDQAATLMSLEVGCRTYSSSKKLIIVKLTDLDEKEKQLRTEIFNCINKTRAYSRLQEKKELEQGREAMHVEQQVIDDLMAHRCIRGIK